MQQGYPFQPRANSTASLAVDVTAASMTLPNLPAEGGTMRLVNSGSQIIFVEFAGVATVSSMPMLPNTVEVMSYGPGTTISAIAASAGSTLYATFGDGI